jgi:hypothetical protein
VTVVDDDGVRWVYVPKHVRIWAEIVRTVAAVTAVLVNVTVLVVVLTR